MYSKNASRRAKIEVRAYDAKFLAIALITSAMYAEQAQRDIANSYHADMPDAERARLDASHKAWRRHERKARQMAVDLRHTADDATFAMEGYIQGRAIVADIRRRTARKLAKAS